MRYQNENWRDQLGGWVGGWVRRQGSTEMGQNNEDRVREGKEAMTETVSMHALSCSAEKRELVDGDDCSFEESTKPAPLP